MGSERSATASSTCRASWSRSSSTPYPDEVTVNMTRVVDVDPLDPDDLTRAEVEARLQVMQLLEFFRARVPGFARRAHRGDRHAGRDSRIAPHRGTLHAHRATTCLQARALRRRGRAQRVPDRHAQSQSAAERRRIAWRPAASYEIPYRTLLPVDREQLLVAGRCISTTHEALASTRLTPTVMTLGQAAGTAAALACERERHASATRYRRVARAARSPTASTSAEISAMTRTQVMVRHVTMTVTVRIRRSTRELGDAAELSPASTFRRPRRLGPRSSCVPSTIRMRRRFA